MQAGDFRADINGLRGLSVLLVVAYHLQLRGAGGGFIGVDVFFVVSGYLMTMILMGRDEPSIRGYLSFVAARARRIWPALAALTATLLLVGAVVLPPFDLDTLAGQALWALGFLSNHHFLAHSGYADRTADDLWLLHTWSLSVEWQFYLLYPLLVFAVLRLSRSAGRDPRPALAGLLIVFAALSLAWQVLQRGQATESGFFLLASRAWEMLAGGLAALAGPACAARLGTTGRRRVCVLGMMLILGSALLLALQRQRAVGADWVLLGPVLGAAAVLVAGDAANPVLGRRWLQALGRWSYSIYLWHWPLLVAWRVAFGPQEHRVLGMVAVALASLALGALSYRWVEQWAWRWRRPAASSPAAFAACATALCATTLLAGAAKASEGLRWRDPQRVADFQAYEAAIRPLLFPDERCHNFRKPIEDMVVCPIGRDAGRRVLVIGDSHAEHLWPWFVRHSEASVDFFGASECPPVPNFERLQPGYDCRRYAAQAWARARAPAYDTVIVSARWATAALAGPPYCHRQPDGRCEKVPAATKPALVAEELRRAIDATLSTGKTVVFLDSAPEASVRVAKRLARERFWYGQPRLHIDRAALHEATAWLDPLLDELAAQPGFRRVSLRGTLCDERRCRVYDDTLGRPIYTDESHFDPVWITENAGFLTAFTRREPPAEVARP
jgi:peptidoglycan/LPS O-acetylase OafA/YrhL